MVRLTVEELTERLAVGDISPRFSLLTITQLIDTMRENERLLALLKWGMNAHSEKKFNDNWYAEAEEYFHHRNKHLLGEPNCGGVHHAEKFTGDTSQKIINGGADVMGSTMHGEWKVSFDKPTQNSLPTGKSGQVLVDGEWIDCRHSMTYKSGECIYCNIQTKTCEDK